jgi:penicillin amidase
LAKQVPWEFKLCGYEPEPWRGEDVLLLLRMIGYLTLAQSQGECERLLVELVQAGVAEEKLHELFPGILGGLDVELIRRVTLVDRMVPSDLWNVTVCMVTSTIGCSGSRQRRESTANVHLEGNRLPAVWCEMSLTCGGRYLLGGSVPGIPGILSGRNNDVAWGVTYAFIDAEDSWVERCRRGQFYREEGDRWIEFRRRTELIRRKGKAAVEYEFFENDHGVLEGDPRIDGSYPPHAGRPPKRAPGRGHPWNAPIPPMRPCGFARS